ncbi:N-6 DNA methylase [Acinetobacter pittii]|uniref:N-6 DNA methylase n=7 Tax=Acinetobacter pittii TaxID=48296 RepID=UPI0021CD878C|nr:N-6 DNA methylase [Acinetobacter pittii]MCU4429134.1 N-6 DNA methylase [Acinetobacter pittii]
MKNEIFNRLNLILKNERNINGVYQNVELISFFIIVRYAEVKNKTNFDKTKYYIEEYVLHCEDVIRKEFSLKEDKLFKGDVWSVLLYPITSILVKVGINTIFNLIIPILEEIVSEEDFLLLASDYRLMIEEMTSDFPQIGEFYTPSAISKIIANMLSLEKEGKIYDPSCGSSGFLLETINHIHQNNSNFNYELIGFDISPIAIIVSFVSLLLIGEKKFYLNLGNSLNEKNYNKYEYIVTNPPFGKIRYNDDNNGKIQYTDYIFLEYIMDSLKVGGQAVVILPERFINDNNKYALQLRTKLINNFNIENIISIPPGSMLPSTAVKVVILSFTKKEPSSEFWVYVLDGIEKFSRKKPIQSYHFDDLLFKMKGRIESNNSWQVPCESFLKGDNIFERVNDKNSIDELKSPLEDISHIYENRKYLLNSLKIIESKIDEINKKIKNKEINCDFVKYKLGDLVKSKLTKPLAKDKLLKEGNYPVYGGNGIVGYYNDYMHFGRFIIVGRVGAYCGNVRYIDEKFWATSNAIVLECSSLKFVHLSYLARILERKDLRKLATGTAQPHLTVSKINNIEIYLPPIEVQIEIDSWLNELEKEISLQKKFIEEISSSNDKLTDSLYLSLLRI